MKRADNALSPQAAVDRIIAAKLDYRRKLAKLPFEEKFRMVADMRRMTDRALKPKQVAGRSDAGFRQAAKSNDTVAALQSNNGLIQRIFANREVAEETDRHRVRCHDPSGDEVPYVVFTGPNRMTLGWVAVCARPTRSTCYGLRPGREAKEETAITCSKRCAGSPTRREQSLPSKPRRGMSSNWIG